MHTVHTHLSHLLLPRPFTNTGFLQKVVSCKDLFCEWCHFCCDSSLVAVAYYIHWSISSMKRQLRALALVRLEQDGRIPQKRTFWEEQWLRKSWRLSVQ